MRLIEYISRVGISGNRTYREFEMFSMFPTALVYDTLSFKLLLESDYEKNYKDFL